MNTWSIIYCPNEGGHRRWRKILRYLHERKVDFDYVQSEGPGSVERLAGMMARHGARTIIVVGGDAALNHALCGIMRSGLPQEQMPRLGVIPNGFGNDFAGYWGMETSGYKSTIDRLMRERVRRIDVGVVRPVVQQPGARKPGTGPLIPSSDVWEQEYFLNCLNIGCVASIIGVHRRVAKMGSRFWRFHTLAYILGTFVILFRRMNFRYRFVTGGECVERRGMTLCLGSAHGYGQTPSAVPYNGQLDLSLVSRPQLTGLFHGLWLLYAGRFLGHKGIRVWRSDKVRFDEGVDRAPVSLDGRTIRLPEGAFEVSVLHEAVDFLY